jgi:hypothetical protein
MHLYAALSLTFIAVTLLAGQQPVGAAIWYAQSIITVAAVVGGILVRERMRGARRAMPARVGYREAWAVVQQGPVSISAYLFVAATFPLYVASFTAWKTWLGYVIPFTWDERLSAWDAVLHGGVDPWRLIHPLFSSEPASHALTTTYGYGWTLAVHGIVAWTALTRRPRFLVANMIAWPICGLAMAGALMSAGPAFYTSVTGCAQNPYRELTDYLRAIGSPAAYWQRYLWDAYTAQTARTGSGLSAMPSMHLVVATLCACAVWAQGRAWRVGAIAFVAVMLVGSVHTAWHYALDGYLGIIAGLAVWWLAGWILRRRSPGRHHPERVETREGNGRTITAAQIRKL